MRPTMRPSIRTSRRIIERTIGEHDAHSSTPLGASWIYHQVLMCGFRLLRTGLSSDDPPSYLYLTWLQKGVGLTLTTAVVVVLTGVLKRD